MSSPTQPPESAGASENSSETLGYAREPGRGPWWARWFSPGQPPGAGYNVGFLVIPVAVLFVATIVTSSIYFARKAASARSAGPMLVGQAPPAAAEPTEVLFDLPPFSLTERSGQTVTLDTLKGKVWIADFVFTTCLGPCPLMTRRMAGLQAALGDAPDVRLLTITVDPQTDTPQRLTEYAKEHGALADKWLFLTGDRDKIFELSTKGFKLGAIVDDKSQTPADHPILHSTKFVLIDRQGRIRAYFDGTLEDDVKRLPSEARKLAAEEAK